MISGCRSGKQSHFFAKAVNFSINLCRKPTVAEALALPPLFLNELPLPPIFSPFYITKRTAFLRSSCKRPDVRRDLRSGLSSIHHAAFCSAPTCNSYYTIRSTYAQPVVP